MKESEHGGNICDLARKAGCTPGELLDFSANINPLGPPDWLRRVVSAHLECVEHYPDPNCTNLVAAAASHYGVPEGEILVGNGTSELLHYLPSLGGVFKAIIPVPSYIDYARAAEAGGLAVEHVPMPPAHGFQLYFSVLRHTLESGGHAMVFVANPNNPTGRSFNAAELRQLANDFPESWFVVDEAFADFDPDMERLIADRPDNVIVLLSMTKFYAIPGLRLGLAIASQSIVRKLRKRIAPWSVNTLAQIVGTRCLQDRDYQLRTVATCKALRGQLISLLRDIDGLQVYPSSANFVLCRLTNKEPGAAALARKLLDRNIAIRVCNNFKGLDNSYFRLAVRTEQENEQLATALRGILEPARDIPRKSSPGKTPAIMLQGTTSDAGKSMLTAALCRIFLQDGLSSVPFKSQNMALNSYVTVNGLEMGRAQVTQAHAARLDPDVRMNPILLKPTGENGSQVVVMGKPVGQMAAREYFDRKHEFWETACNAYDELSRQADVMVLEGAGSPAEINLMSKDIVNMAMARHANAKVLLISDIDRGGSFAHLIGTMECLPPQDRKLVKGFVLNKFRGDASLLDSAVTMTREHTGVPTLGIIPHLGDLCLPDEDSVNFKEHFRREARSDADIDIAVIDLPHIANFTDLDALNVEPDVSLRRVCTVEELGQPDALIIPGSKNTPDDLRWLRESGMAEAVGALRGKTEIIGVCGGFQMLGERVADPHGLESGAAIMPGMGVIPIRTVLAADKTLRRVTGVHLESGHEVRGYEIHHGRTELTEKSHPVMVDPDGEALGYILDDRIWGTYLHGLFDADEFRRWFVDGLRQRKGLAPLEKPSASYDIDPALDRLADAVRNALDMEALYSFLKI